MIPKSSICCQAALPAMAFGELGSRGLTFDLTGGPSVSMACSTLCLTVLKSGLSKLGYLLISCKYFGCILALFSVVCYRHLSHLFVSGCREPKVGELARTLATTA